MKSLLIIFCCIYRLSSKRNTETHSQTLIKLKVSHGRREGRIVGARMVKDTVRKSIELTEPLGAHRV